MDDIHLTALLNTVQYYKCWSIDLLIIGKAREFQKNIYFCFMDYAKAFDCVAHNKPWKILRDGNTRTPYLPPEKSVCRTRSNGLVPNWERSILSPCLVNLYLEYIMWNAWLDEAQAEINIAGRNINKLRHTDDTTLTAESEELKSFLMKVKEESEKVGLQLNIQKNKLMASGPITSWQTDRETKETVMDFIFLGSKNHCKWWLQSWN